MSAGVCVCVARCSPFLCLHVLCMLIMGACVCLYGKHVRFPPHKPPTKFVLSFKACRAPAASLPRAATPADDGGDEEFFEAKPMPEAKEADDGSVYLDARSVHGVGWDAFPAAVGGYTAETTNKVDELLLEELTEAWETETRSEGGETYTSRRTRLTALDNPAEVEMKIKEMAALRQALDFAMTSMLQRQAK